MSSAQLPLDLPPATAMGRADFFEAPCNAHALSAVLALADSPRGRLLLLGPPGSGRTHLVHIFAEATGAQILGARDLPAMASLPDAPAVAVDDVDRAACDPAAEEALFHLCNATASRGQGLLLTGTGAPPGWPIRLPDLASRLAAFPVARLQPADDALLTMVLAKLFHDRQLTPDAATLRYLVARMERSFDAARALVAEIDRASLAERRRVTRALAASVLAKHAPSPT